jgi:hypothetical protein
MGCSAGCRSAYIKLREMPAALQARLIFGLSRSASSNGRRQAKALRGRGDAFMRMAETGRLHISGMATQPR